MSVSSARGVLLLLTLYSCCLNTLGNNCPELQVPSYGSLMYNGNDVTTDQPLWNGTNEVQYQCASGYQLVKNGSGEVVSDSTTICQANNDTWSLEDSSVRCTREAEDDPTLTDEEVIIILGAGLGSLSLILSLVVVIQCCCIRRLYLRLAESSVAEDEIAFAQSHRGNITAHNPLIGMGGGKDEEAAGNPLYLTPDELNEFENKNTASTM